MARTKAMLSITHSDHNYETVNLEDDCLALVAIPVLKRSHMAQWRKQINEPTVLIF